MGRNNDTWKIVELENTADAAIFVSASNLRSLFQAAAMGMYSIAGVQHDDRGKNIKKQLHLSEVNLETLLISFLSELLFILENGLFFNEFHINIEDCELRGMLIGFRVLSVEKEIKAATFCDLQIKKIRGIFSTKIVFDL